MRLAEVARLLLLFVCINVFSTVRSEPVEPGSERTSTGLVRSLAECVRGSWIGVRADRPAPKECWDLLRRLSEIPADQAVRLVREEDLNLVESHLVEIAMALRERPTAWPALEVYYDMAVTVRGGGGTLRGARSPRPMAAHLRKELLHAWRWMMLCPRTYEKVMGWTAARALALADDTDSLELMAAQFRWLMDARAVNGPWWMMHALAAYPEDSRTEALRVAFRCWHYARSIAGEEIPEDSTGWRKSANGDEPAIVLDWIAEAFPEEAVLTTLEKAENDPEFVQFLEQVRDLQTHESK